MIKTGYPKFYLNHMSGTRLTYIVSIPNLITSYRIQIQAFKTFFIIMKIRSIMFLLVILYIYETYGYYFLFLT